MIRRAVSGLTTGRAARTAQDSDEATKAPDSFIVADGLGLERFVAAAAMMQSPGKLRPRTRNLPGPPPSLSPAACRSGTAAFAHDMRYTLRSANSACII
jgi:hypothetical protein